MFPCFEALRNTIAGVGHHGNDVRALLHENFRTGKM